MEPSTPLPDPMIGTSLGGRFRLVRKLGEGAMGAVYEAIDGEGQTRAVKIMRPEIAERSSFAVTRFVNEARATAALRSPHIVTVVDGGVDEAAGVPYLVMELLRGFDCEQLLERVGAIDPVAAVRMVVQAAHGLVTAHAAGIIHRDVKPSNLFLEERPEGAYVVKVCDFGTAKLTGDQNAQITKTGAFLGSPLFMSPEQSKSSKHVDERSDVWSLGVTLYCLLSGRAPHEDADSLADLLTRICTTDTPHLQNVAPWVEPGLAAVVHAALLREPAARWPSIAKFGRALMAHTQGDTRLHRDLLVGMPPESRARKAERAAVPTHAPETVRPPARDQDRLLGTTLAGRYHLVRELGRGGMGAVYEALDSESKRYAVKVVLDQAAESPDAIRRFVREARASSEIKSPHVVAVVDADTDLVSRVPFIVMELLSGTDLDVLIESTGPLDPTATVRIFRQACLGLGAAHERSVVHRDIKPANIFLDAAPSGEITVKICDFGIAKQTATDAINRSTAALTATGGLLGSPTYMSPEQARNAKKVDTRTDIWSLCMSMYEALSGGRPWGHCTTVGELILAICTEDLPPLSRVAPWVDPALGAVVEQGLQRDLSKRWTKVEDLRRALEPFAGESDSLDRAALRGVPLDDRWNSTQRMVDTDAATISAASAAALGGSTLGANSISPTDTATRARRTSTGLVVGATIAAMLAGALGLAFVTRSRWLPPAPVVEAPAVAAVAAAVPAPALSPAPPPVAPPEIAPPPSATATTPSATIAKESSVPRVASGGAKRVGAARASAAAVAPKPAVTLAPAAAPAAAKPSAPKLEKDW